MRTPLTLLLLILSFSSQSFAVSHCSDIFNINSNHVVAEQLAQDTFLQTDSLLEKSGMKARSRRGYAILVGTMVGSAALTTYLGSHLPSELQFTSIFLAQVSTLGVYVLGAPIWEPLSSRFRKWAFGIRTEISQQEPSSLHLESTWIKTQEKYSLNAQMSRNVVSQFILAIKDNFYNAYRAHRDNNPQYSADQVAEAAYRMRVLFKDVDPADPSVVAAVHSAFTNHIEVDPAFIDMVWFRLRLLDTDIQQQDVSGYYQRVFKSWF